MGGHIQRFFMLTSSRHTRFVGLWALLLVLAGVSMVNAQSVAIPSFQISGKTCVPDQECKADSVTFTDSVLTGVTTRVWDFGDGSTVTTQGNVLARHVYQQQGSYKVTLTRTVNGVTQTTEPRTIPIYPRPRPFINWKTDTTICKGEKITLDPYGSGPASSGLRFLWYPKGDTTQTIQVDSSGCYSVEAIDPNGCSYQDRINVDVCGEQKESQGVKWYFGQNAGLDFSGGGTPKPITDGNLSTIEGSSSIANTKGILLFYTDGLIIYDKDGKPLKSLVPGDTATIQTPLGGNQRSTQSALIVPKPTCRGCEYLYYVYTTSEIRGKKVLSYSVVDMRKNGGKGAIVEKNVPVSSAGTEQSASVRNDRDSTYWVITRVYGTNQFEIRHLTSAENPTLTTYSGGQKIDSIQQAEGYIKIGPADTTGGNKGNRPMAVVIPGPPKNSVDLYTFNDSTGQMKFNRTVQLGPAPPKAYGVEFSPDGKSLYVTMLADTNANGSQKGSSYIVKYDLNQTTDSLLTQSRTVVDSSTTRQYGSIQIGPDGRLYVAIKGSSSLGTIENPNGGLLDSLQFNPSGQTLGGKTSQLGLPNLVANFNDNSSGPGLTYGDTCANQPTVFQISPNCPKLKEAYTLDFGDGSQPKSTTATQPIPHTYTKPGQYFVSLHIITKTSTGGICKDTLIKDTLTIVETPPDIRLGADTSICNKKGLTLDIKVAAKLYVWIVNGRIVSRQKTVKLDRPGYYQVIGLAANGGCYKTDTILVQIKPVPSLDLGPDTLVCYRSSVSLKVPQLTWNKFLWSNGGTDRTTSVSTAGIYSVTATNPSGCENTDSINVKELPKIALRAALTNPTGCTSVDGTITVTPNPAGVYSYIWTRPEGGLLTGTTNRQINLAQGAYKVQVTDSVYQCKADTSFALNPPAAPTFNLTKDASLCVGDNGKAQLVASGPGNLSYRWTGRTETTGSITVDQVGTYQVQVTDPKGCTAIGSALVINLCEPRVSIPDAFTPNNDGLNDVLQVFTAYVSDYEFRIYNRWGEVIFVSNNPEQKWDGTYRGTTYPSMLYPYIISYKSESFPERPQVVKRGSVLLIR
jgi:gliding motility-associated-like protein